MSIGTQSPYLYTSMFSSKESPEWRPGRPGFRKLGEEAEVLCHVVEETSGSARGGRRSGCGGRGLGDVFTSFGKSIVDGSSAMVSVGTGNYEELGGRAFELRLDGLVRGIPEVGDVWLPQVSRRPEAEHGMDARLGPGSLVQAVRYLEA